MQQHLSNNTSTFNPAMTACDLDQIKSLVADELVALDDFIDSNLTSQLAPISELNRYIINSGGKRLRPLLVLLVARALGNYRTEHLPLAAIIEFIHTATLLHDDVVDDAELRRGKKTVKHLWGNNLSILVGDFLYSRAFQLIAQNPFAEITAILANTTNVIAEGEVRQLLNCRRTDVDEATYLTVIYSKTAILFETAAHAGALIAGADKPLQQSLSEFGRLTGLAFQMLDDALDYDGQAETGKTVGGDLAESKATAPFIYALEQCSHTEAQMLNQALVNPRAARFEDIYAVIKARGGLQRTYSQAEKYAEQAQTALAPVPDSVYKQALKQFVAFAVARNH